MTYSLTREAKSLNSDTGLGLCPQALYDLSCLSDLWQP